MAKKTAKKTAPPAVKKGVKKATKKPDLSITYDLVADEIEPEYSENEQPGQYFDRKLLIGIESVSVKPGAVVDYTVTIDGQKQWRRDDYWSMPVAWQDVITLITE